MHVARLMIAVILVLAVVVAYSPQMRDQAIKTWDHLKPAVVGITDSLYVVIQNFISITPASDETNETPSPGPGGDFDRVVTMSISVTL